jgi:lipopolysaccharide biosynthesis protein
VRRLFIFAHFDLDDLIDPYVIQYLSSLADFGSVMFVSTSQLSSAQIAKVRPYTIKALWRPNVGYDFMSWQLGLKLIKDPELYDETIICNDSVYAPIFPLGEMFEAMENSQAPYWGVTSNSEVARHIQSYFVAFRRPVLDRQEFWQFWNDVSPQPNKRAIIERYEVGLSLLLEHLGFSGATYFSLEERLNDAFATFKWPSVLANMPSFYSMNQPLDVRALLMGDYNKTLTLWKELILARVPMIKVELVRDNPKAQPLDNVFASLERYSDYPIQMIKKHLERIHSHRELGWESGFR